MAGKCLRCEGELPPHNYPYCTPCHQIVWGAGLKEVVNLSHFTLCIDPGFDYAGCALFWKDELREVSCIRIAREKNDMATSKMLAYAVRDRFYCSHEVELLVIEQPCIRPGSKARPQDIMKLYGSATTIALFFRVRATPLPHEWKGNVPKAVFTKRILSKMTDAELMLLKSTKMPKGDEGHVVDAIGLGLWHLGRMR